MLTIAGEEVWELWFGDIDVGRIRDPLFADDTGYGVLDLKIRSDDGETEAALVEFLQFCKDWNRRLGENPQQPPSDREFDRFGRFILSEKWRVKNGSSEVAVSDAPVLFPGDEISWRPRRDSLHEF